MPPITSSEFRFREFREAASLSHDDVAQQMGISASCIWDIEACENELADCYSPVEVSRFCRGLGIRPGQLFGVEAAGSPVSAVELVGLIHEECRSRHVTLEQFEDAVGWRLSACIEPPSQLLEDMTLEGLQWLCRELRIDWHRVLLGL
jgi:hypothetical protein